MVNPELRPNFDFARDISAGWGILPIEKGSEFWQQLKEGVQFEINCFDRSTGGFSQRPGGHPDLWSTRLALESLWWSEAGLGIDDAISRLKKKHGDKVFERIVGFVSNAFAEDTESRDDKEFQVGGFRNEQRELSTATTFEAIQVLFTLEELLGEKGSIDAIEREHPQAFSRILNLVDLRWMESGDIGGFAQVKSQSIPDIWGTNASLDIVKHLSSHRFEDHQQETADWIKKIQSRTDQIMNLLKVYQDPRGGFGFSPNSHPNVFSTLQAAQVLKNLILFNPGQEAHLYQIGGAMVRMGMADFTELLRVPSGIAYYGIAHTGREKLLDLKFGT